MYSFIRRKTNSIGDREDKGRKEVVIVREIAREEVCEVLSTGNTLIVAKAIFFKDNSSL